jgi:DNA-binding PadR family transcriptional regulator
VLLILDLFILALIADGVDTPYRWQRQAAISTGASLPSIRRLAARGLVNEAETGPRGRRRFSLTRAGRSELKNITQYVETALNKENLDVESLLRLAVFAYASGKRDLATSLLKQSAVYRQRRIDRQQRSLSYPLSASMAESYSEVIAQFEIERQEAAIRTINLLISNMNAEARRKTASRKGPETGRS